MNNLEHRTDPLNGVATHSEQEKVKGSFMYCSSRMEIFPIVSTLFFFIRHKQENLLGPQQKQRCQKLCIVNNTNQVMSTT